MEQEFDDGSSVPKHVIEEAKSELREAHHKAYWEGVAAGRKLSEVMP